MMIDMGNHKNASIRALIATNDNLEAACNWLFENGDKDLTGPIEEDDGGESDVKVDNAAVEQVMELGFDKNQATIALLKNVNIGLFRNQVPLRLSNGYSIVAAMSPHLPISSNPKRALNPRKWKPNMGHSTRNTD